MAELPDQRIRSESRFSFRGTVRKVKAATMPQVPVTDRTVVVHVNGIIHAPKMFGSWLGRDVTVLLAEGEHVQEGQHLSFLANGWLYGAGVALRSMGHELMETQNHAQVLADRDLAAHLDEADLVLTGQVAAVRLPAVPAGTPLGPRTPGRRSEHDPLWREAVTKIESVEKGTHTESEVIINFPASTDIAWYKVPKLQAGDEGVFALHKHSLPQQAAALAAGPTGTATAQTYAILHPVDFQPKQKLGQIRDHLRDTLRLGAKS